MDLTTDISYLKGVGPQRAQLLGRELGIFTYNDLLNHFPFRYVDRSVVSRVAEIDTDKDYIVLRGTISNMQTVTNGHTVRLTAQFRDMSGTVDLVWFQGVNWIRESLKPDTLYLVMGKVTTYGNTLQMAHPDIEPASQQDKALSHPFIPIYSTTEKARNKGLNQKGIARLMETLLEQVKGQLPETLPADIRECYHLMPREAALNNIHFPRNNELLAKARERMKFEELFNMQLDYQYTRSLRLNQSQGRVFDTIGEHFNRFYNEKLPFELTGAQKRVIKEIRTDLKSGRQMNRLLQGDVGSGKTMVALFTMLMALDNQCQACMMAPTEILANQHYNTIRRQTEGLGIAVELLTGSLKAAQKRKIKARLAAGEIDILIGTHALIEDDVVFQQLGLVVIDEQHRFGVKQRAKLWAKNTIPPHVLVMTATPIPRTLAMTLYADLECSVIDELPPGRRPIQTLHATDAQRLRLFGFMREQIAKGRQVYVVYPLINESEKSDLKDLMDGYDSIRRAFPLPQYGVSILHGQMTPDAKDYEMAHFKSGENQIMVSTTVIEVGVDVPNATVMVIENAERFGLSQLHQLRGRVGRGGEQSYCILMTKDNLSATSRERIQTMCATNDGFRIAEADLRLRGPGDIQGLQQSGMLELKLADIVEDEPMVKATRDEVRRILEEDPQLAQPDHYMLRKHVAQTVHIEWNKIS